MNFWDGFYLGWALCILLTAFIHTSYKRFLRDIGDKCDSIKILGRWYKIVPEEKWLELRWQYKRGAGSNADS